MESFFGAMSGIGILLAIGYLLLTIFIIVYFFRMANDVRALKESLDVIKKILVKQNWSNENESTNPVLIDNISELINTLKDNTTKTEFAEVYTTNKYGVVTDVELKKNNEAIDRLISKIKPNQCIVRVLASSKMVIWDKTDWVEILENKRDDEFKILFKNFDL
jgi:uncharacterized membrane protein YhiD involved in acid resistance